MSGKPDGFFADSVWPPFISNKTDAGVDAIGCVGSNLSNLKDTLYNDIKRALFDLRKSKEKHTFRVLKNKAQRVLEGVREVYHNFSVSKERIEVLAWALYEAAEHIGEFAVETDNEIERAAIQVAEETANKIKEMDTTM